MNTVADVAKAWKVSISLIYALVESGKLRHCRIGLGRGRIRIPDDAITEYLEGRMVAPPEPEARQPWGRVKLRRLRL